MPKTPVTYKSAGVDYSTLDPVKRLAQLAGKQTAKNISDTAFKELEISRGESAYVLDAGSCYFAFVEECLGTKTLIADAMYTLTGKTYYDQLAQDAIAMIVNDLTTVGARVLTILAYWGGNSEFFENTAKTSDLISGWKEACNLSGAVWGGGESPSLNGIVEKGTIDLAGAAFGVIDPKTRLTLGEKLGEGDAIVFLASNGIHANGLSLARKISESLPQGYLTQLPDGRSYGQALLDPTYIYAKCIQDIFASSVDIHYMANITGHGWRKIMRHPGNFMYKITSLPPVPQILRFLTEHAGLSDEESYSNLNMGAGFTLFVNKKDVEIVMQVAKRHNIASFLAGEVVHGEKAVSIEPKQILFQGSSLQVRE